MIAVGEEGGRLEELLRRIAEAYEEEVELAAQKMTAMLEPIMIVVMAMVVGFIILAVLLPILEMSNL
jgi:type II secretory pathway component PulF